MSDSETPQNFSRQVLRRSFQPTLKSPPRYDIVASYQGVPAWAALDLVEKVRENLNRPAIVGVDVRVDIRFENLSKKQVRRLIQLDEEMVTHANLSVIREDGTRDEF